MATPDIGDFVIVIGELKNPELLSKRGEIIEINGSWYTVKISGENFKLRLKNLQIVDTESGDTESESDGEEEEEVDADSEEEGNGDDDNVIDEDVNKDIDKKINEEDSVDGDILDEDLDSLVNRTMNKFSSSKFNSKSKACSALHNRLLSSGKAAGRQLVASGGRIEKQTWKKENLIEVAQRGSELYDSASTTAPQLKTTKEARPETVGKGWFDFQPLVIDEKIKRDIKMIQMRNYLDPKRFYKNPDKMGKVLHVGTVIEGPSEYFSSRMSRKERKQTIVEEVLGDEKLKNYSKRKYMEIQSDKNNKKKMFKQKKKGKR
mmetsp:Transcript_20020/g.19322  ORF Transcript_20020/g.19322 Transcript_20020/m.19322 type:complete len:319 (+) Transcript_20020:69-1025(+)|eukprot:CAMPEP_0119047370 /NCGR_PEP_ID=MMETSP1177-20130426/52812_1 /TAXON_ID=2985 /ORGANISM="Ochromonas sp, Strain CCMP1899" /LENGTH=318 /DNA_ID=CAMNT_0007021903 /DNA_START=48 /DNA_END=1004 /DNA_ORIENTATION=-